LVAITSLGNQRLVRLGAIAVRGVDEVHAEFERPGKNATLVAAIAPPAPGIGPAQAHGAEAEAIHAEIAEADGACVRSGGGVRAAHFEVQADHGRNISRMPLVYIS
jgi:hypothetical protein